MEAGSSLQWSACSRPVGGCTGCQRWSHLKSFYRCGLNYAWQFSPIKWESQQYLPRTLDVRTKQGSNRDWGPGTHVKCKILLLGERGTQGRKDEQGYLSAGPSQVFRPVSPTIRLIWVPGPWISFSHGLEYHGLGVLCMIDSSLMPQHRPRKASFCPFSSPTPTAYKGGYRSSGARTI